MRLRSRTLAIAALSAVSLSAAGFAAPGDRSVSSDGSGGPAPSGSAKVVVNPSLGTGSVSAEEIVSRGATLAKEESFPSNGLATVAYGAAVGKRGESIINWDSRTRSHTFNYPTRAIVFIELNGAHLCTGFMYAPNMVATAGHCVHSGGRGGSWYRRGEMKVYPGKDGTVNRYGRCNVVRLFSVVGWTRDADFRYDYGAIRLNCNIGSTVGWFGLYEHPSPTDQPSILGGYPGDKPREQWTSSDKIRSFSAQMLAYRNDTVGGHSGSPVWHDRNEALAANGAWAIGVHNYGVGAFGTNSNAAARLTATRIQNYINWRDAP